MKDHSSMQQQLTDLEQQSNTIELHMQDITEADPLGFFARSGKKFVNHTKEAVQKRKNVRNLRSDKQNVDTRRKFCEKHMAECDKGIQEVDEWLEKQKGPFKSKFDITMDSFNLKRQVYHSGALIGKDIDTVFFQQK
jgi:hypothetical protein